MRETQPEDQDSVGRRPLDVPGYTFRISVTNRTEPPEELWRDCNQRATIEQRIEELKNALHIGGFCAKAFYTTVAVILSTLPACNLLPVHQSPGACEGGLAEALDAASRRLRMRRVAGEGGTETRAALLAKRGRAREAPRLD